MPAFDPSRQKPAPLPVKGLKSLYCPDHPTISVPIEQPHGSYADMAV
jgi:hypothetical protein